MNEHTTTEATQKALSTLPKGAKKHSKKHKQKLTDLSQLHTAVVTFDHVTTNEDFNDISRQSHQATGNRQRMRKARYTTLTYVPSLHKYDMKANPYNAIPKDPPKPTHRQTCTKCKKEKTLKSFQKDIMCKLGRSTICTHCRNLKNRQTTKNRENKRKRFAIQ